MRQCMWVLGKLLLDSVASMVWVPAAGKRHHKSEELMTPGVISWGDKGPEVKYWVKWGLEISYWRDHFFFIFPPRKMYILHFQTPPMRGKRTGLHCIFSCGCQERHSSLRRCAYPSLIECVFGVWKHIQHGYKEPQLPAFDLAGMERLPTPLLVVRDHTVFILVD